MTNKIDHKFKR